MGRRKKTRHGDFLMDIDYSELFAGLDKYASSTLDKMEAAMEEVAEDGIGRMQAVCPVISGRMQRSGKSFVKVDPAAQEFIIIFGFNTEYAAARHELDQPGRFTGGGKFVENPLKLNMRRWMAHIAQAVRP